MIGNCYTSIVHFRRELIQELVSSGYDVWMAFPNHSHGEQENGEESSKELGCKFVELYIDRRSTRISKEIALLRRIFQLLREIRPDCTLLFTIKPNIYGGVASIFLRVPFIVNITGLGSGINDSLRGKLLLRSYISICNRANRVFFQNTHDMELFRKRGLSNPKTDLLPGSGVNLSRYSFADYPCGDNTVFLYDARIMREKGIDEYLYVASMYKDRSDIQFYVCGDCEDDYSSILSELVENKTIKYFGRVSDVRPLIKECNCIVIPSFYNEGVSNCLLEAASCGRPIVTTDHAGCREVVDDGVTGFLVKPADKKNLKRIIEKFIDMPAKERKEMGKQAREKMEREFSREIVVNMYMKAIKEII